ncbi:hypothetical protein VNO78_18409 [Psophocarpus tetragonolobus]|uniref:Uncharacterized protein n=1 Tax=Psophocarpus tetragonolobus TaxID=3891 RepID=A0AAN9XLH2_PSOTE
MLKKIARSGKIDVSKTSKPGVGAGKKLGSIASINRLSGGRSHGGVVTTVAITPAARVRATIGVVFVANAATMAGAAITKPRGELIFGDPRNVCSVAYMKTATSFMELPPRQLNDDHGDGQIRPRVGPIDMGKVEFYERIPSSHCGELMEVTGCASLLAEKDNAKQHGKDLSSLGALLSSIVHEFHVLELPGCWSSGVYPPHNGHHEGVRY